VTLLRVIIRNGEAAVELDDTANYTPTIMRDLCDQAVKTYDRAFDDEDEPADDTEQQP